MWWEIAANIATIVTSISLIFTVVQLIREKGDENTASFFYLHKYLSQEQFSAARKKICAPRLVFLSIPRVCGIMIQNKLPRRMYL